jgi:hypothetical protein
MSKTSHFVDDRPKPEPLNVRKERQAAESKQAWQEYRAKEDAVNRNMERLRALRLARVAESAPAAKKRASGKATGSKSESVAKPPRKRGRAS